MGRVDYISQEEVRLNIWEGSIDYISQEEVRLNIWEGYM